MDIDFNKLLDKKIFSRQEFAIVFTPSFIASFFAYLYFGEIRHLNQLGIILAVSLGVLIIFINLIATIRRGRDLNLHEAISIVLFFIPFVNFIYFICLYAIPSRIEKEKKDSKSESNLSLVQEAAYQIVGKELDKNFIFKGLWTKAESLSDGSIEKIKANYLKLRVESFIEFGEKDDEKDVEYFKARLMVTNTEIENIEEKIELLEEEVSKLEEKEEKELTKDEKESLITLNNKIERHKEHVDFHENWKSGVDNILDKIDPDRIAERERQRIKRRNKRIYISIGVIVILDVIYYYYNEYSLIGVVFKNVINWLEL